MRAVESAGGSHSEGNHRDHDAREERPGTEVPVVLRTFLVGVGAGVAHGDTGGARAGNALAAERDSDTSLRGRGEVD